jgi:germination protein M
LRETVLYFPDQAWRYIIPVRFPIPWEDGIARATLTLMTDGRMPAELVAAGLAPLLPAGTEILGLTVRDGLAMVDFSRAFLGVAPARERQLLSALIFTLTEFPTINRVELLVEGQKLTSLPGGTPVGIFDRGFGLNREEALSSGNRQQRDHLTLYFLTSRQDLFVPVSRAVPMASERIKAVVQELLRGPARDSGLTSAIPPGLELLRTELAAGRLRLFLYGEPDPISQPAAGLMRDQLALTLTELSGVTEIELLINGKSPQTLSGVSFPTSFGRPPAWNKVEPAR